MRVPYTLFGAVLAVTFAFGCSTTPESGLSPVDATFVSQQSKQSTPQEFEEFCRSWEGRWIGETVTAQVVISRVADGKALLGTGFFGEDAATFMVVYDAGSAQIKESTVLSNGSVFSSTIYKQDGKWLVEETGSLADGTLTTGTWQIEISDGGDTHHWTGSVTEGGQPTDPRDNLWRRVSKPSGM